MNKFFRAIKQMPDRIANLNRYCLQKFKEDPNLIPDGNADSTVSAIKLDWFIGINPDQVLIRSCGANSFSWVSLPQEDEPPVLSGTLPHELINNFSFPLVLVLRWTGMNENGEEVFLDISGANQFYQVIPFVPSLKNDIRRLFDLSKNDFLAQEIQKGDQYHAKFIPQLSLLNEDWDAFFVNEDLAELNIALTSFSLINGLPYDNLVAFVHKKCHIHNKIIFELAYNNKSTCVNLSNFYELRLSATNSWIFTR